MTGRTKAHLLKMKHYRNGKEYGFIHESAAVVTIFIHKYNRTIVSCCWIGIAWPVGIVPFSPAILERLGGSWARFGCGPVLEISVKVNHVFYPLGSGMSRIEDADVFNVDDFEEGLSLEKGSTRNVDTR